MMIWPAANAIYRRETYDNYPAAKAILSSVFEGLQLPMDLALAVESRYFAKILRSKEAAAMIRSLFLSIGELNKGVRRPAGEPATELKKIGIIGAGFMGAGVAYVSANAGLEVVLDRSRPGVRRQRQDAFGKAHFESDRQRSRQERGSRSAAGAHPRHRKLRGPRGCDLVVEAVFEDRAVKKEATEKAQAVLGPEVVFASNTSTLPITSLAKTSRNPRTSSAFISSRRSIR